MLGYKWLLQLKKSSYKPSCKTPYFLVVQLMHVVCHMPLNERGQSCESSNNTKYRTWVLLPTTLSMALVA
jgi:hypothetical protein